MKHKDWSQLMRTWEYAGGKLYLPTIYSYQEVWLGSIDHSQRDTSNVGTSLSAYMYWNGVIDGVCESIHPRQLTKIKYSNMSWHAQWRSGTYDTQ